MSKYSHKDLLEDYRLPHNQNKARVYEYKNSLMEISNTLREINAGKSSNEQIFFQKLEDLNNPQYLGNSAQAAIEKNMKLDRNGYAYETKRIKSFEEKGYAPHVSSSIMFAYCRVYDISNSLHKGKLSQEYASMIVQRQIIGTEEASSEVIESCVKQALCFEALKNSQNIKELTPGLTQELHHKAAILSSRITSANVRVLDDRSLMQEAFSSIDAKQENPLAQNELNRLVDLNHKGINMAQQSQIDRNKELERKIEINKYCEISI